MKKNLNEFRDPIHNFIHVERDELLLIDSRPFQRLRHIHQLALTYLIYPAASHKRFEHSLGVMELASKAFDAITATDNVDQKTRKLFPQISDAGFLIYWRKILRLAALCHDLGHPPFSHAAEKELFPEGFTHESMTRLIIESNEMKAIFAQMVPRVEAKDVVKLALGKKSAADLQLTDWEAILAEIITGDSLGVDRIDYLLRDAYHLGVAYGKFDHFRLLETLRIVPPPPLPPSANKAQLQGELSLNLPKENDVEASTEPMLGLLLGGLRSAEALLLARYFMYAQVYYHPVRIAYNRHLKDYMSKWLPNGKLPINVQQHLELSDNVINAAILSDGWDSNSPIHLEAKRITSRDHFRCLKEFAPEQIAQKPLLPKEVYDRLVMRFGADKILIHAYQEKRKPQEFSLRLSDGETASSLAFSIVLRNYPTLDLNFILVDNNVYELAAEFLKSEFKDLL